MKTLLLLILITLIPTLELRASIPFGILATRMPWWNVVLICVITNICLGPLIYLLLDQCMFLIRKINLIDKIYQRAVIHTRQKIQKSIDRYGEMGIALFIVIPLPGT